MNTIERPARNSQITGDGRTARKYHGVVGLEFRNRHIVAHLSIAAEQYPFFLHQLHPPVNNPLVQFEIGDTVAEQSAGFVIPLIYCYLMARLDQLRGSSKTRWAATHARKSVVSGKSVSVRVDLGGRRIIKKKKELKEAN